MAVSLYLPEEVNQVREGASKKGSAEREPACVSAQTYLIRVLVNHGSSAMGGTAESIRGWDLMNDRVSSGKSMEVL